MRRFLLKRTKDETGVSGAGYVLTGAVLPSGRVVVEWFGQWASVTIHESMESFRAIHMSPHHPTSNELIWIDHEQVACQCGHPLQWHLTGGGDGKLEYCEGSANGLCDCSVMQPVAFQPYAPLSNELGYFGSIVTVPQTDNMREAMREAKKISRR